MSCTAMQGRAGRSRSRPGALAHARRQPARRQQLHPTQPTQLLTRRRAAARRGTRSLGRRRRRAAARHHHQAADRRHQQHPAGGVPHPVAEAEGVLAAAAARAAAALAAAAAGGGLSLGVCCWDFRASCQPRFRIFYCWVASKSYFAGRLNIWQVRLLLDLCSSFTASSVCNASGTVPPPPAGSAPGSRRSTRAPCRTSPAPCGTTRWRAPAVRCQGSGTFERG